MEEIWKNIEGTNGRYQISNLGRVKSFTRNSEGLILKPHISRMYEYVGICKKGSPPRTEPIHRLVAKAFVPNPNNFKEVNHIDENKLNNRADNLEWCTRQYNMSYKTARLRQGISNGKPVEQTAINNDVVIAIYPSAKLAGEINNIDESSILKCCHGKRTYAGGYGWRFSNQNVQFFNPQAYNGISSPQSHES